MSALLVMFGASLAVAQTPPGVPTPRGTSLSTPTPPAFVDDQTYHDSLWITPNGDPVYTGPMLRRMLGAGNTTAFGGGNHVKVGLSSPIFYSRDTLGPNADPLKHMAYVINIESEARSLPLPPDMDDVSQLPVEVRHGPDGLAGTWDDLPQWANAAKCPRTVAALEWARYLDLPITFQMQAVGPQGGAPTANGTALDLKDLDSYIESLGKDQCMWDAANQCDPDDDPSTYEQAPAGFGNFSHATPTLADPAVAAQMGYSLTYRALAARNAASACAQLIRLANLPRYSGRIVALAIDPEIHYPAYQLVSQGPASFDDYHPATIRGFTSSLRDRYGDSRPGFDSNGDGRTFVSDYGQYYVAHAGQAVPTSWDAMDAPRLVPTLATDARDPYWHLWCNYLVGLLDGFLEQLVESMVAAGVPADRVFTHQTLAGCSYNKNRVIGSNANVQWLDEWAHLESSYAQIGVSIYQPFGILPGLGQDRAYFENYVRRDENFGSPEFNPMVVAPGAQPPTLQQLRDIMDSAWNRGAQVLWPHYWGGDSHPAMDRTGTRIDNPAARPHWRRIANNGTVNPVHVTSGAKWTWHNAVLQGGDAFKATSLPAFMESPSISLSASEYPCIGIRSIVHVGTGSPVQEGSRFDATVEFRDSVGTWHSVTVPDLWVYATSAWQDWGIDLSQHPAYVGTITGLRIHPVGHTDTVWAVIDEVTLCGPNDLTTAMQGHALAEQNHSRPPLPLTTPIDAPQDLMDLVVPGHADGRVVVYGNDPIDASSSNPSDFKDFGLVSPAASPTPNFAPTNATCGGVTRAAIRSPASQWLGQWRTGKFRRLALPDLSSLVLRFGIGIEDGNVSVDGVRFRISIRDHSSRRLDVVFDREHRTNSWSDHEVDLSPWAGHSVDLMFEVHGIGDSIGDASAWSAPSIVSAVIQTRAWLASAGYETAEQGLNQWTYEELLNGNHAPMTIPSGGSFWQGSQPTCLVGPHWQHPEASDSCRIWHAYRSGTIDISGPLSRPNAGGDGVVISIYRNGVALTGPRVLGPGVSIPNLALGPIQVVEGDRVEFRVNRNGNSSFDTTIWNPTISLQWYGGY